MSLIDDALEILEQTEDGELLTPLHLKLTELAVNGFLNEASEVAFAELHASVMSGEYVKTPHWFHGIEHLTKNHEGYVLWKDRTVDHYSFRDAREEKRAALKLAARCRRLEARGMPVTGGTVHNRVCLTIPEDSPWKVAAQWGYTFFGDDEGDPKVVIGIFSRKASTENTSEAVIIFKDGEGNVQHEMQPGAYEAYHAVRNQGNESIGTGSRYPAFLRRVEALGITPQELNALINT